MYFSLQYRKRAIVHKKKSNYLYYRHLQIYFIYISGLGYCIFHTTVFFEGFFNKCYVFLLQRPTVKKNKTSFFSIQEKRSVKPETGSTERLSIIVCWNFLLFRSLHIQVNCYNKEQDIRNPYCYYRRNISTYGECCRDCLKEDV